MTEKIHTLKIDTSADLKQEKKESHTHNHVSASQFPRSEATNSVLTMRNSVFFRVNS